MQKKKIAKNRLEREVNIKCRCQPEAFNFDGEKQKYFRSKMDVGSIACLPEELSRKVFPGNFDYTARQLR